MTTYCKLYGSDHPNYTPDYSYLISGNGIVAAHAVTTGSGSVEIYDRVDNSWVLRGSITPADGATGDGFGGNSADTSRFSLNYNGDKIIVGACGWEGSLSGQGAAYVYEWNGSAWVLKGNIITETAPPLRTSFGYAVSINDDATVAVVSFLETHIGQSPGYVLDYVGGVWIKRCDIPIGADATFGTSSSETAYCAYAQSVSISGDGTVLAVGANRWGRLITSDSSGKVFFFKWNGSEWIERIGIYELRVVNNDYTFGRNVHLNSDGTKFCALSALSLYNYSWDESAWVERGTILCTGYKLNMSNDMSKIYTGVNIFVPQQKVSGFVYNKNAPVAVTVKAIIVGNAVITYDDNVLGTTTSSATTGAFTITNFAVSNGVYVDVLFITPDSTLNNIIRRVIPVRFD